MNFYKSTRWKNKRSKILRRDSYECQECKRYGNSKQANTVHHVFPLETHPEYKLVSINLISLCEPCHDSMHARKTGELTDKGMRWVSRVRNQLKANIVG